MTLTAAKAGPTLDDARRAAAALAEAGVSQVLLFGSVARGTQNSGSDIDLVAIFDDLDYSIRYDHKSELASAAGRAAGQSVDVHVTDRPEWAVRSRRLATTFERRVAAEVIVLHEEAGGDVNWSKEIGLPNTDHGEAAKSLLNTHQALGVLIGLLQPTLRETDALEDRDPDDYLWALAVRLRGVCSQAQSALETALKSLLHLYGHEPPPLTHDLVKLATRIPEPVRGDVLGLLREVTLDDASKWREQGTYVADFPDVPLEDLVPLGYRLAVAAHRLALFAAEHVERPHRPGAAPGEAALRTSNEVRKQAALIERVLNGWDLTATTPTDRMGLPPPPETPITQP